jgi:hypothetical protein
MKPDIKEALYTRLMNILLSLEEGDFNGATMGVESLVNDVQMDKIENTTNNY